MEKYWILLVLFHMAGIIQIGRSQDQCEVKLLTEDSTVFVPYKEYITLNCSYTCDKPLVKTRLSKSNETNGPNWVSYQTLVDDWEKSEATCFYTPKDNATDVKIKSNITIMAYALPSNVTIDLQRELEEGATYSITCTAHDVAPVSVLIISVIRGGDEIYNKTYDGDLTKGPANVTEIYHFTASRSDNLQDFACLATLQLGTVPNTKLQSLNITVRTYALPDDPSVKVNKWIEYGTSAIAECQVHNVFPQENVSLQMFIGDEILGLENFTIGNYSATGSVTLANTSYILGQNTVTCISQLLHLSRNITKDVNVYETPNVEMTLSSRTVDLDDTVTADCMVRNRIPGVYCLAISVNGQRKQEECIPTLSHNITASSRHPEINVTCTIHIQDYPDISQTATETIAVHYPPQFSDDLCPNDNILVEDQKLAFPCGSEGSPHPVVQCRSEAWSVPADAFTVTRNMSDQYECNASNIKGTQKKTVRITVQYPPVGTLVIPSHNGTINTRESFNLTCQTDALPVPVYTWKIPTEDHVTFSPDNSSITISNALCSHNGTYTCVVKNKHGTSEAQQEVVIKGDDTWIWAWILIAVLLAVFVIVAVVIYICIKQKGKKGFYSMLTGSKKRKTENGLNKKQKPQNTTNTSFV